MRRQAAIVLFLAAISLCLCAHALSRASRAPRVELDFEDGTASYTFVTEQDGLYDIVFLDAGEDFEVTGAYVMTANSRQPLNGVRLAKTREYTVTASGSGSCTLEIMRRANGLNLLSPLEAGPTGASGILPRENSCGWFAIEGYEGLNMLTVSPVAGDGLTLAAALYDGGRKLRAESVPTVAGDAILSFEAGAGERLYLRIWSPDGSRGMYSFSDVYAGETAPEELTLSRGSLEMFVGSMRVQRAATLPEGASDLLIWRSGDEDVVAMDGGILQAVGPGETYVYAYAYGGLSAKMKVTVEKTVPQDMFYYSDETYIPLGESFMPRLIIYPSTASTDGITYESSDESVAVVSTNGEITAVGRGEAAVTARSGELETVTNVVVTRPTDKFRVLLVGEENYDDGVNTDRPGAYNSVAALANLFGSAEFSNGMEVIVSPMADVTKEEFLAAAGELFGGAPDNDVYLLYLTCHGIGHGEKALMQFTDGSTMDADELYSVFAHVNCTVVIMLDCCGSGAVIGAHDAFAARFEEEMFSGPFLSSRFKLLLSASIGQDSYRIGSSDDDESITTVFARALCDALGYSIDGRSRGPLGADRDFDGMVTLNETYLYVSRRVNQYLSRAGGGNFAQEVKVYPAGDPFVLFER